MTVGRVVLYGATAGALGYIAAVAVILHGADLADHANGWYQLARDPHPIWRLAWR